jgi:hypothetical protein
MRGLLVLLGLSIAGWVSAQMSFDSERELNNYAWSNSNLSEVTTGFLTDFVPDEDQNSTYDHIFNDKNQQLSSADQVVSAMNYLERTDIKPLNGFDKDDYLKPITDSYFALQENENMNVPLFILDYSFSELVESERELIDNWSSDDPFSGYSSIHFKKNEMFVGGILIDTVRNSFIHIYWDDNTFLSNKNRQVQEVEISINKTSYILAKGQKFSLEEFYADKPLNAIGLTVTFDDNSVEKTLMKCNLNSNNFIQQKANNDFGSKFRDVVNCIDADGNDTCEYSYPALSFSIGYGCGETEDEVLDRPYIIVAGWGTWVPVGLINSIQGWPTSMENLYYRYNENGFIDELINKGYDVVIARFVPPNAEMRANATQIKRLINHINAHRVNDGSDEEIIIQGYSAGALAIRYALLDMEKEHLEGNGPHHHCKLYVSYEGEHAGANIPLAAQHSLNYLDEYHSGLTIYTLNQILVAPLSQGILKYFFGKTGYAPDDARQGASDLRYSYLADQFALNHDKSWELNRHSYPAFVRMLSVSNGANKSDIVGNYSNHYPYEGNFGHEYWIQNNSFRQWDARFLRPNVNSAFLYRKVTWGWQWQMRRYTDSPHLIDNTPGGIMVLGDDNPLRAISLQLRSKIVGAPDEIDNYPMWAFTPTVYSHDLKYIDPDAIGGKVEFDLRIDGLMYQDSVNAINGEFQNASNKFGYPHLRYPDNHYTDYTPFDAVCSWSENTEHIVNKRKLPGLWEPYDSQFMNISRKFIVNEASPDSTFIQNRQYGWNARPDYTYRAAEKVHEYIEIGSHVTQRTNFKPVEIWANASLDCQAGDSIHITDGFHAQAGSEFHAMIDNFNCAYPNGKSGSPSNNMVDDFTNDYYKEIDLFEVEEVVEEERTFSLAPNPGQGTSVIQLHEDSNKFSEYSVLSANGSVVLRGRINGFTQSLYLEKGVYMVHVKLDQNWISKKLVIL